MPRDEPVAPGGNRVGRHRFLLLCLIVIGAACTPGPREAEPFAGTWRSQGYGSLLVIDTGSVAAYEVSSASCLLVFEGSTRGIGEAIEREGDQLLVRDGDRVVTFSPAELPKGCAVPRPDAGPQDVVAAAVAAIDEHHARLDEWAPEWQAIAGAALESSAPARDRITELLAALGDPQARLSIDGEPVEVAALPDDVGAVIARLEDGGFSGEAQNALDGTVTWERFGDIGYLAFTRLAGGGSDRIDSEVRAAAALDQALGDLADTAGLVLDLRAADGGADGVALLIASRFVTTTRTVATREVRAGDDFIPGEESVVRPIPGSRYEGDVAVLTGPGTVGAAELLVLALRPEGRVTTVGSATAGSLSPVLARTLPNGWVLGVPNQRVRDVAGTVWDLVGIPPDVSVEAGPEDPVLDRAVAILTN